MPTEPVGVNLVLEEDRGDRLTDDGDANANGDVVDVGTPIFQPIESKCIYFISHPVADLLESVNKAFFRSTTTSACRNVMRTSRRASDHLGLLHALGPFGQLFAHSTVDIG